MIEPLIKPLLNGVWEKGKEEGTIVGKWFEDGSQYTLKLPEQLVDPLIQMQSNFVNKYKEEQKNCSLLGENNEDVI